MESLIWAGLDQALCQTLNLAAWASLKVSFESLQNPRGFSARFREGREDSGRSLWPFSPRGGVLWVLHCHCASSGAKRKTWPDTCERYVLDWATCVASFTRFISLHSSSCQELKAEASSDPNFEVPRVLEQSHISIFHFRLMGWVL